MEYLSHTLNLAFIFVVLTVSLNLILGYGGMASMAHAAFFCIGGYVSTIVTMNFDWNFLVGVPIAIIATAAFGGILAAPFIKVQEEYLILFTIAFQMVIFHLMLSLYNITGGDSGIFGVPSPELFGFAMETPVHFLPFMALFVVLVYWVCLKVTKSPFGRVLKGTREDEQAATSLGKNVIKFKVIVFMVGTGIAAGAGSIFAHYTQFISPAIGSLDESILIIAMVVLGGTANLWGSAVGAFLLIIIPEILNFLPGASDLIVPLRGFIYGVLLILFMRFRPEGLVPEYFHFKKTRKTRFLEEARPYDAESGKSSLDASEVENFSDHGPILEVKGVSKSFGGLKAVDNFVMSLEKSKITALVGPNGCGKTTAFNLITGFLKAHNGQILFQNKDLTNLPAYKMPHKGIVRSWQDVRVFQGMTVLDNLLIARQNQSGESLLKLFFMPWQVKKEEAANLRKALSYLEKFGLREKALEIAHNLSFAEQKLLALARLLTTEAEILLLDEPSSGVDPNWVEQFMDIIRELARSGKTICIVEHNLEVVRGVSDTVYFMADGRTVAQGTPEELMADPELGEI
ncbi:MAG: branched-chain amino acid ABC transporter ATP-binding protein/permease, partial [Desulfobacteraceae bacterium]|nr:branched-chain amino acid ABC transporter ATP-binding protein/permease [Desulfobacteraceae bacterium]